MIMIQTEAVDLDQVVLFLQIPCFLLWRISPPHRGTLPSVCRRWTELSKSEDDCQVHQTEKFWVWLYNSASTFWETIDWWGRDKTDRHSASSMFKIVNTNLVTELETFHSHQSSADSNHQWSADVSGESLHRPAWLTWETILQVICTHTWIKIKSNQAWDQECVRNPWQCSVPSSCSSFGRGERDCDEPLSALIILCRARVALWPLHPCTPPKYPSLLPLQKRCLDAKPSLFQQQILNVTKTFWLYNSTL